MSAKESKSKKKEVTELNQQESLTFSRIRSNVLLDNTLTHGARLLMCKIESLTHNKNKCCWMANSTFAELFNVTERTIKNWIRELVNKKYIISDVHDYCKRDIYLCDIATIPDKTYKSNKSRVKIFSPPSENSCIPPCKEIHHTTIIENDNLIQEPVYLPDFNLVDAVAPATALEIVELDKICLVNSPNFIQNHFSEEQKNDLVQSNHADKDYTEKEKVSFSTVLECSENENSCGDLHAAGNHEDSLIDYIPFASQPDSFTYKLIKKNIKK